MSNFIEAMIQYGAQVTANGLANDADREALSDNLAEYYRAKAYARLQEVDALSQGAQQIGAIRTQASLLEGQQRVAYAMSGIDASSGSAAANIGSSRLFAELDAATARNNAAREALGHRRSIDILDLRARDARRSFRSGQAKRTAEDAAAAGSVLQEYMNMGMGGM